MCGKHRDLLFWSRRRCFACKIHRWSLGHTETCYSSPKGAILHAQNNRWGLEPIETCNSGPKVACKNHWWGLGPIETSNSDAKHGLVHAQNDRSCVETCYSGPEDAVLPAKSTGGVLDPQKPVILVLKALFCMHKTTGEVWNQYSLFVLVLSTL